MDEVRYIHAADLHLDAPFYALAKGDAALAERVHDCTFKALDNLVQLCLAQKPDFLLLAGDIAHQPGVRARLRLRDACAALGDMPVFLVHGNHDPLADRLSAIAWPANTVIFGPEVVTAPVRRDGETIALIHGCSHAKSHESRNLASQFHRDPSHDCFQIGLLHCNVDGAVASDRYAPCSLGDLVDSGLDAWALGHAHTRQVLRQRPFIAYAGNTQGLHANENSARGCLLVRARRKDGAWACDARFQELDAARWQKETVDMERVRTLDALDSGINNLMVQAAGYAGNADTVILQVELTGRTELHSQLAAMDLMAEFGREPIRAQGKEVWLQRLLLNTAPPVSPLRNVERDDLLGEISRLAQALAADDKALAHTVNSCLLPLANACRQTLPPQTSASRQELLARAERICQDMLEGR